MVDCKTFQKCAYVKFTWLSMLLFSWYFSSPTLSYSACLKGHNIMERANTQGCYKTFYNTYKIRFLNIILKWFNRLHMVLLAYFFKTQWEDCPDVSVGNPRYSQNCVRVHGWYGRQPWCPPEGTFSLSLMKLKGQDLSLARAPFKCPCINCIYNFMHFSSRVSCPCIPDTYFVGLLQHM